MKDVNYFLIILIVALVSVGIIGYLSLSQEQDIVGNIGIDTSAAENSKALQEKDSAIDSLQRAISQGCYRFYSSGWEEVLSSNPVTRLRDNPEILENIPIEWDEATICGSLNYGIISLLVRRDLPEGVEIPEDVAAATRELFPEYHKQFLNGDQSGLFTLYLYAVGVDSDITIGDRSLTLQRDTYKQVAVFAWDQIMAGCYLVSTPLTDGIVTVACGAGANVCWNEERARVDIFTSEKIDSLVCTSNCDLEEGEHYQFTCK
ncbi:MAG: hypothetical protein Q8Q20_02850 [bacterium]|nr:hypothetical protein [bacterium]